MEISGLTATRSQLVVRNHDALIMVGYVAVAIFAIGALHLAYGGGPGAAAPELTVATVLP